MNKTILSQRESEVLRLIAYEHTNQQIADRLHISHHTVNTHRKSMPYKLRVKNTTGLIRRGLEEGIRRVIMKSSVSYGQMYHSIISNYFISLNKAKTCIK